MTCARQSTLGATHLTALHSAPMASASAGVRVTRPPPPELTPPTAVALGSIWMTLAPRLAMGCSIEEEEPRPISIMAMTAAMAMMTTTHGNNERMVFRRKACKAGRRIRQPALIPSFMPIPSSTLDDGRQEWILGGGLGICGRFTGDHFLSLLQIIGRYGGVRTVRSADLHFQWPN